MERKAQPLDFYLVHSVHESSWSNYVKYHAYDQLNELRKAGKIKRLGFSFHGSAEQLSEILAAGAVSYTHLFDFKNRSTVVKALCLHVAHTCNLNCEYCFAAQGKFHGPVSYTHLDVYKRQWPCCVPLTPTP